MKNCKLCHKTITPSPTGPPKKFCSKACRIKDWDTRHREHRRAYDRQRRKLQRKGLLRKDLLKKIEELKLTIKQLEFKLKQQAPNVPHRTPTLPKGTVW